MATKAERFKSEVERTRSTKKAKKKAVQHRPSLGRKAMVAFEEVPGGVPSSRKSTRRSKNRQKSATALTGRNLLVKSSPKARHDMGPTKLRAPR